MVVVSRSVTNHISSRYGAGGNYFPIDNCQVKIPDKIKVKRIDLIGI
jgi:hypothetical protein